MKYLIRVLKAAFIGALVGWTAAGIAESVLAGSFFVFSATTSGRVIEGVAAAFVGAFCFFVAGGLDGAPIGALVGSVSCLTSGSSLVRGICGGIAGAGAGVMLLKLRFTVDSGELNPGAMVVCLVVTGAICAGAASAVICANRTEGNSH